MHYVCMLVCVHVLVDDTGRCVECCSFGIPERLKRQTGKDGKQPLCRGVEVSLLYIIEQGEGREPERDGGKKEAERGIE